MMQRRPGSYADLKRGRKEFIFRAVCVTIDQRTTE